MTRLVMGFSFEGGSVFEIERTTVPKTEPKSKRFAWILRKDRRDVILRFVGMDETTRYFEEGFVDIGEMKAVLNGEMLSLERMESLDMY